MNLDWYEQIYVEHEQVALLEQMIEADNTVPKQQRDSFVLVQTQEDDFLIRAGMPRDRVSLADLDTLTERGLLRLHFGSGGNRLYDVTPNGRRYYAEMKRRSGEALETVESEVHACWSLKHSARPMVPTTSDGETLSTSSGWPIPRDASPTLDIDVERPCSSSQER
jgi:hypothetical protein